MTAVPLPVFVPPDDARELKVAIRSLGVELEALVGHVRHCTITNRPEWQPIVSLPFELAPVFYAEHSDEGSPAVIMAQPAGEWFPLSEGKAAGNLGNCPPADFIAGYIYAMRIAGLAVF